MPIKPTTDTPMMSMLLTLPLFCGLTMEQLMSLLEKAVPEFITLTDVPILRRGERHSRLLFILQGTVTRQYTDPSGRCTLCEPLHEGDIVEFASLFGRGVLALADYYAEGEVRLLAFDKQYLFSVFNRYDIVQMNILNLCCAHADVLHAKLTTFPGDALERRFCHLVEAFSVTTHNPKRLKVPRTQLAELLGCSRRPMSERIAAWEKEGLVQTAYGEIIITNLHALMKIKK